MQAVNFNADSCFTVNGTSALKADAAPNLYLIEGGRRDTTTQPVRTAPISNNYPIVLAIVLTAVVLLIGAMSIFLDSVREASFSDAICNAGTGAQTSDVVDWIRRENNLSSSNLSIGQNLVVPNCSSL